MLGAVPWRSERGGSGRPGHRPSRAIRVTRMSTRLLQIFKDLFNGHNISNILASHVSTDRGLHTCFIHTYGKMLPALRSKEMRKHAPTGMNPKGVMLMK